MKYSVNIIVIVNKDLFIVMLYSYYYRVKGSLLIDSMECRRVDQYRLPKLRVAD